MPLPRFEVPLGPIDGVNKAFTVSAPYRPGTTAVFINGQLKKRTLDDGWVETDPAAGIVTLNEAPVPFARWPEVVQIFYLDTSPALPETVVERLVGSLVEGDAWEGSLASTGLLEGSIAVGEDELQGELWSGGQLAGLVEERESLYGWIVEVC